jgi:UDP-glucose 4-epimerase
MNQKILVTGGAGYIGSHTVIELIASGYQVVIVDNFSNSKMESIHRIEKLSGTKIEFFNQDIRDFDSLSKIFAKNSFDSVIHFAGLKSVSESEKDPVSYFENNIVGSLNVFKAMLAHNVNKLIFSSSATVYGDPGYAKCTENTTLNPLSVYGKTKLYVEEIIRDIANANNQFKFGILRYFNPVGAHASGEIGEDPNGIPNNLMPFISQVAVGKQAIVNIWGNDYQTSDGTGKRDYIHVQDLASGHIAALKAIDSGKNSFTVNLGTGNSYSVLEVIDAFSKASGKEIPFQFEKRRSGDVAENYADPTLAKELLNWSAKFDLTQMCEDSWRWQSNNPNGFN